MTTSSASTSSKTHPNGINFLLNEEQLQIQELARNFTRDEIIPVAAHHDRSGEYPSDLVRKAWSLGLRNTPIPEQYGGAGLSDFTGCLIAEELAYGCAGIMTALKIADITVSSI